MKDIAVDDVRERRRRLVKEAYGGSMDGFVDEAIRWSKEHPTRTVDLAKSRHHEMVAS